MSYFVNYSNYKIQLLNPYATFGVIGLILGLLIIFTCRKNENNFFDIKKTQSLRGVAILLLILGHLSLHCLSEKLFFSFSGNWAIIIFLFISGYGLHQKYKLRITKGPFWGKRIKKICTSLDFFSFIYIVGLFFINLSHPVLK